jgi:hypothetical protein
MMFNPSPFLSSEPHKDEQQYQSYWPYISQTTTDHTGRRVLLSLTDEVLNWQSKQALAQNHMLTRIDLKVDHIAVEVQTLKQNINPLNKLYQEKVAKVQNLDKDLKSMVQENYFGPEFNTKEHEPRRLQKEHNRINREKHSQQQKVPS